jgi:Tfp pilus assembly protein PilF
MKKVVLLSALSLACFVTGCVNLPQTPPAEKTLKTTGAWDVNRSVMLAAENSGNYEIALKTGDEELAARPDNDEAKIIMARLLSRTGQAQRASSLIETVKEDPDGLVLIERVRCLIAMNQGSSARELIDEQEEMGRIHGKENLFEAHKLLAVALDLEGDNKKAQTLYSSLLAQREDPAVRMNFGRSLIATGNYAQAAEILMPLVDSPKYPQARILAAGAVKKAGDKRQARSLLEGYLPDKQIDGLLKK